jgi:hypothetical protein
MLQQLDLLNTYKAEAEKRSKVDLKFPVAFPIAFCTHMCGRKFRLACLWRAKTIEVCPLLELTIGNQTDLKRCFLIRHEVIKIVQAVGEMLNHLITELPRLPPPCWDRWWRRHCCTKVRKGKYILCDRCGGWHHWECIKLKEKPDSWYCFDCKSKLQTSAERQEDRELLDSKDLPMVAPCLQPIRRISKVGTSSDEVIKC